jgi:hypothetical protein
MKKLLFSLAALAVSTGLVFAQEQKKKANDVAKFKMETIDLGKIKQDNPSTAIFEVTNISNEPLIIEQANPTCGCTVGDYTKEPIAPGKTGFIKATYNAKNLNAFEKNLTVKFAGVDEVKSITIKGEVLNADEYAKVAPPTEMKEEKVLTPADAKLKNVTPANTSKGKITTKTSSKAPVKKVRTTTKKTTTTTKTSSK